MATRGKRLVLLAKEKSKKEVGDRLLDIPKYESTKTTTKQERDLGLKLFTSNSPPKFPEAKIITPKAIIVPLNKERTTHFNRAKNTATVPPLKWYEKSSSLPDCEDSSKYNNDNSSAIIPLQPLIISSNATAITEMAEANIPDGDSSKADPFSASDSDDDYVPSPGSVISDTSSEGITNEPVESWADMLFRKEIGHAPKKMKSKKTVQVITQRQTPKAKRSNDFDESSLEDSDCDGNAIKVTCSQKSSISGKRIRNKRYCCYLCQKIVINLSRHLISIHSKDTSMAKILALPKNSKPRRKEFGKLMREGNFYHNCEVLQLKRGELILSRRPTPTEQRKYTYVDYGPCPDCIAFMLKKNIAHHLKYNCTEKSTASLENRKPISESNYMLAGMFGPEISSEFSYNILMKMRDDEITKVCRGDLLIVRFGSMMFEKYNITQAELIRQSMRQIGRLLLEVKKLNKELQSLSDCLKPQHFDLIVQATKTLCISTSSIATRPQFQTPSLALKIGHSIKKCVGYERGNALRKGNIKRNRELESFLSLLGLEWNIRISSNALNTLHTRKFNCTQLLPITSDLIKLNTYLENQMKQYKNEVLKASHPSQTCWSTFAALTLTRIVIFNKRRSGETSRMTMQHYATRPMWSEQTTEESKNAMTPFEKQLAKHFSVVEIPGKRGRRVPILLTPDMKDAIDLLLNTRTLAGVNKDNPYIFARCGNSLEYMRGHDYLRKFSECANLQAPENINGTKLRKYVATVTQIINLTENETDWLARHLGHDVRVHRDFYRLHESAVELTKVSRLLMAVDSGEANKFAGKTLKEIELTDLPQIELEPLEECEANDLEELPDVGEDMEVSLSATSKEPSNKREKKSTKAEVKKSKKKLCTKKAWSEQENAAVLEFFAPFIKKGTLPGKLTCEECIEKYEVLSSRKWTDLKFYIKNYLTKIQKTKFSHLAQR